MWKYWNRHPNKKMAIYLPRNPLTIYRNLGILERWQSRDSWYRFSELLVLWLDRSSKPNKERKKDKSWRRMGLWVSKLKVIKHNPPEFRPTQRPVLARLDLDPWTSHVEVVGKEYAFEVFTNTKVGVTYRQRREGFFKWAKGIYKYCYRIFFLAGLFLWRDFLFFSP